jgi:pyridoxal phosphate enzyme (YggS family)
MAINKAAYKNLIAEFERQNVTLVAVSKTKPVSDIKALYDLGHRDFGENYVQELVEKQVLCPEDIRWHYIGHLQSNKVKYIAPFVHLIHGVDSLKLLLEIDKQGRKNNRVINCLLQVHIAQEETKFGFSDDELMEIMEDVHKSKLMDQLQHVAVVGLMGMASNTADMELVRKEFKFLKLLYNQCAELQVQNTLQTLSMGMSNDYQVAVDEGTNMVRIGSLIFGSRPEHLSQN